MVVPAESGGIPCTNEKKYLMYSKLIFILWRWDWPEPWVSQRGADDWRQDSHDLKLTIFFHWNLKSRFWHKTSAVKSWSSTLSECVFRTDFWSAYVFRTSYSREMVRQKFLRTSTLSMIRMVTTPFRWHLASLEVFIQLRAENNLLYALEMIANTPCGRCLSHTQCSFWRISLKSMSISYETLKYFLRGARRYAWTQ